MGIPAMSTTEACSISILGENKNGPYLLHDQEIEVFSGDIVNPIESVVIATINATDDDHGRNGEIYYSILYGDTNNNFDINNDGKISLKSSPTLGFYHLTILVKDGALKSKNTTCSVLLFFKSKSNVAFSITAGRKVS